MDNPIIVNNLTSEQARQRVDCEQVFRALQLAEEEARRRFAGSMSWKTVGGTEYLYRRRGKTEQSLGPRSPATENAEDLFRSGKARNAALGEGLRSRLAEMAPVNVALRLGRVPNVVARIIRSLDRRQLLGKHIMVVGTNALFAYEAAAGVQFDRGLLATSDVDFALDARKRLGLASDMPATGLIGILREIDASFQSQHVGHYRAVNAGGFMVDLITPAKRNPISSKPTRPLSDDPEDLSPAEVERLQWLVHAPRFEAMAIQESGLPLRLSVPDPRFFAAHKLWLAAEPSREPTKTGRDREQGLGVAALLAGPLSTLPVDAGALGQLPATLRAQLLEAIARAPKPDLLW